MRSQTNQEVTRPTLWLGRAFDSTRAVLAEVQPDQLDAPTPCVSWDVRTLINHFIGTARWAVAAITIGEEPAGNEEDYVAGDFLAAYEESVERTVAAFESPGALEKMVKLSFGEFPGAAVLGMTMNDQFTHGWDLARAIGHHTDLDPELADLLLSQAHTSITDAFRGADGVAMFGPIVEPSDQACAADRLAAFLGRSM